MAYSINFFENFYWFLFSLGIGFSLVEYKIDHIDFYEKNIL